MLKLELLIGIVTAVGTTQVAILIGNWQPMKVFQVTTSEIDVEASALSSQCYKTFFVGFFDSRKFMPKI